MEKIDARTLNQEAQEALRNQIVRLRKTGRSHKDIADIVGVSVSHCSRVWTRYQKGGAKLVAKGKRGRRQGEQRKRHGRQGVGAHTGLLIEVRATEPTIAASITSDSSSN